MKKLIGKARARARAGKARKIVGFDMPDNIASRLVQSFYDPIPGSKRSPVPGAGVMRAIARRAEEVKNRSEGLPVGGGYTSIIT